MLVAAPLNTGIESDICRALQSDKARSLQSAQCHGRRREFLENRFCLALSCCEVAAPSPGSCMHFYGNARQRHTKFNELQKAAKVLPARFTPATNFTQSDRQLRAATCTQFGETKRRKHIHIEYIYDIYIYGKLCVRAQLECKSSWLRLRCATSSRCRQIALVNALNCALCGPN